MPSPTGRAREVVSAGAVVLGPGAEVLLVHRPKYDDWSFPKGKLDRGEHATSAAIREVEEETGVRIRLGVPLRDQRYPIRAGTKLVHYWVARAVGDGDVSGYQPNSEIDEVGWFPIDKARRRLTYQFDVDTLAEALHQARKTRTLLIVRHSQARSRKAWRSDDRERPLLATGKHQAERLVPLLSAYDVRRMVSSSSTRCLQTLEPYAEAGAALGVRRGRVRGPGARAGRAGGRSPAQARGRGDRAASRRLKHPAAERRSRSFT